MRILLVEDEKKIASFVERGLIEQHYIVDIAYDGDEGLYLAEINPYDLIILDVQCSMLGVHSFYHAARKRRVYDLPGVEKKK